MKILSTYRDAFSEDDELLGHVMKGETWRPHHVLNMSALGETLTDEERVIYRRFTGRDHEPGKLVSEYHTIGGRAHGQDKQDGRSRCISQFLL